MNIYVGNLAPEVTEDDLRKVFGAFGEVSSVSVVRDRHGGHSKGFAFLEMPEEAEGQAAIDGLNRQQLMERTLDISESRPRGGGKRGGKGGRKGGRRR
jgi:RNA recognition motif-containing protein